MLLCVDKVSSESHTEDPREADGDRQELWESSGHASGINSLNLSPHVKCAKREVLFLDFAKGEEARRAVWERRQKAAGSEDFKKIGGGKNEREGNV